MQAKSLYLMNMLAALLLTSIVAAAGLMQLVYHELPCPLCLLQRVGILLMAVGLLANVMQDFSCKHYGLTILSSLFTLMVSVRQVFLHILPGDAGYGAPFLGIHLYTWVVIISLCTILGTALLLLMHERVVPQREKIPKRLQTMGLVVWVFTILVICFNIGSTLLECGLAVCSADPSQYLLIQ
jgi:disulfide bond formation protein DsbB